MNAWTLYDTTTGYFTAGVVTCSAAQIVANTPEGFAAVAGAYDYLSQMVDVVASAGSATPVIVDYQPEAPADDALQTWAWDAGTKRWTATPTLAANKLARAVPVQSAIDALEAGDSHQRSLREILLAVIASEAPPSEAVTALGDIDAEIATLRETLAAIDAAPTQQELDAVE